MLTLARRQILQVNQDREVEARLDSAHVVTILALEDLLSAISYEILEASYLDRKQNLGLGFGVRNVKGDAIKVRHGLVDGGWRGSV